MKIKTLAVLLGAVLLTALWRCDSALAASATLAADDLFTIAEVTAETDVGADDAIASLDDARRVTLERSRRDAFYALLREITLATDAGRLPQLPDEDLEAFIEDFEIHNEKFSPQRYIVTLSWRFKRKLIAELLSQLGIEFVASASPILLITPLYSDDGLDVALGAVNPWLSAWRDMIPPSRLLRYRLPLTAPTLTKGGLQRRSEDMLALARSNDAAATVAARAMPLPDDEGVLDALVVNVRAYAASVSDMVIFNGVLLNVLRRDGETESALFARAAGESFVALEERWKSVQRVAADSEARPVKVFVFYDDLAQWLKARRHLEESPLLNNVEIVSLSRQYAEVDFTMTTPMESLRARLLGEGLDLSREGERWIIQPASQKLLQPGQVIVFEESFLTPAQAKLMLMAAEQDALAPVESEELAAVADEEPAGDDEGEGGGAFANLLEDLFDFGGAGDDEEIEEDFEQEFDPVDDGETIEEFSEGEFGAQDFGEEGFGAQEFGEEDFETVEDIEDSYDPSQALFDDDEEAPFAAPEDGFAPPPGFEDHGSGGVEEPAGFKQEFETLAEEL